MSESSVSTSEKNSQSTSQNRQSQEEEKHPGPTEKVNTTKISDSNIQAPTEDEPISNVILAKWEQLRCIGKLPERRSYHTGTSFGSKYYIYGGYDIKEGDMKSMFCLDASEYAPEWQEVNLTGDYPKGISRHSVVVWDDKIYCLGGENNNVQLK